MPKVTIPLVEYLRPILHSEGIQAVLIWHVKPNASLSLGRPLMLDALTFGTYKMPLSFQRLSLSQTVKHSLAPFVGGSAITHLGHKDPRWDAYIPPSLLTT